MTSDTFFYYVMVWWLLPFLIMLLMHLEFARFVNKQPPEKLDGETWSAILVVSTLWPLGAFAWFCILTSEAFKHFFDIDLDALRRSTEWLLKER